MVRGAISKQPPPPTNRWTHTPQSEQCFDRIGRNDTHVSQNRELSDSPFSWAYRKKLIREGVTVPGSLVMIVVVVVVGGDDRENEVKETSYLQKKKK